MSNIFGSIRKATMKTKMLLNIKEEDYYHFKYLPEVDALRTTIPNLPISDEERVVMLGIATHLYKITMPHIGIPLLNKGTMLLGTGDSKFHETMRIVNSLVNQGWLIKVVKPANWNSEGNPPSEASKYPHYHSVDFDIIFFSRMVEVVEKQIELSQEQVIFLIKDIARVNSIVHLAHRGFTGDISKFSMNDPISLYRDKSIPISMALVKEGL